MVYLSRNPVMRLIDIDVIAGFFYFKAMETKKELRRAIAQKKKMYAESTLQTWSDTLLQALEKHPLFQQAQTILMYYSLPDEVQTHPFIERWSSHKTIILPVVKGEDLELRYYTGKQGLKKGSYGIEEPTGRLLEDYRLIELAIIPGVSFDLQGNRLGRGKGYYDRLLPHLQAYNIGICFEFQVSRSLPTEAFDQKMDEVWTENGSLVENDIHNHL